MRKLITGLLAAGLATLAAAQDNWPSRAVRVIVPYSAGSAADAAARVMADKMSQTFGQPFVIDNRAGANGSVGMQAAAQAKPDGYTLVVSPGSSFSAAVALTANLPYDPLKDFVPVGLISSAPVGLVVGKDHPANTMQEFIALAKANPGKQTYASSGGVLELVVEALKQKADIKLMGINYKGPVEASVDVMAGRVDLLSSSLSSQVPQVNAGKLKALAVMSPKRFVQLPNVPTMMELGYKDFTIVGWNGLFAPAGTPAAIVTRLNTELNRLVTLPDVKKQFDTLGFDVVHYTPAQFTAFVTEDVARLDGIARAAGIQKK